MTQDMKSKQTIRIFFLMLTLFMGSASKALALVQSDIVIDPAIDHTQGSVAVKSIAVDGRTVTITVTPTSNYYLKENADIIVYKLVSLNSAPTRSDDVGFPIADRLVVTAVENTTNDYQFMVPDGYGGAWVSVVFTAKTPASAVVSANDLTYNQEAQELVTLSSVTGGRAENPVTYSLEENGVYSTDIPTGTDAGNYTVYYKVAPDDAHSESSGSVNVTIKKAPLTSVTLNKTVLIPSESVSVTSVKAGSLDVPSTDYDVRGADGTAVGSYTLTVTAREGTNFTGIVTENYRIVNEDIIRIPDDNLGDSPSMTAHYIITADVDATVLAKLYTASSGTTAFSGTLEAAIDPETNMPYKISGLSAPLFTKLTGTVKNLVLEGVSISGHTGNTGAIACEASGSARIYNVGILPTGVTRDDKGNITGFTGSSVGGTGYTGGLVGLLDGNGRVINCYSYATITGGSTVGGIVGYNNVATTAATVTTGTMVMNCMFYGDITGGTTKSPVYGGNNINNLQGGLNTFNYYAYEQLPTSHITSGKYNNTLAVEEKYLNRFEFYRLLLNSNKKLATFYVTGSAANANLMAKWVLETADRSISDHVPYPYPILKAQGYYPSIINYDAANAPDSTSVGRKHGGKLPSPRQTLSVTISGTKTAGGQSWPTGAGITTSSLPLYRTDKDFDRFNYNYDKVQLPYYNDVGTGNYTGNRVVTGWKITDMSPKPTSDYSSSNYPTTGIKDYPNHNYADRKSVNKDLYTISGRVFSQGAYFDVPYGVTSITIEPYWGKACYIADENYDVVYKNDYSGKQNVTQTGTQVTVGTTKFNEQDVQKSIEPALNYIANSLDGLGPTVYDNALVLVGNLHLDGVPLNGDRPFTMMSVDEDNDHEPDYSLIYHHKSRQNITPIRFDFLTVPGTAQAQKPNGASLICNFTIFKTRGWFEVTNTAFMYSSQIEYENGDLGNGVTKKDAPLILLGGIFDQFVSTQSSKVTGKTIYIHVGSNVWIKEFGLGTHSDGSQSTPHVPVSVTGGEFPGFYLTGTYNANAELRSDNAECYISSGYFHEVAGASQEAIGGNVRWQIYNADIDNFYGGGTNDAKPIQGNVTVDIYNSHVTTYCGGPKFGNMQSGMKVKTNADGCVFGKYFGAGYGGLSYSRKKYYDASSYNWNTLQGYYTGDRGKYYNGTSTGSSQISGKDYGKKGPGVATDFDYEFFVWSSGQTGARFFVKFASFSLAQCNDVESKLKNCTIENNYYGGGSFGKVVGTINSELDGCTVKGNVYGAGYSAPQLTLEVRDAGFTTNPNYNSASGMFEPGVFSGTTTFQWETGNFPQNGSDDPKFSSGKVTTNVNLETSNLGSVAGNVNLTLKGNTKVGTLEGEEGAQTLKGGTGNVFGGGEMSYVTGQSNKVTVTLQGNAEVYGNVFGGGNEGLVEGSTEVNIKD